MSKGEHRDKKNKNTKKPSQAALAKKAAAVKK
jgi:hypothetical protein